MGFHIRIVFILCVTGLFASCRQHDGTIRIIHAGSLTIPVREAAALFEEMNPGVRVLSEAWGSKAGARRVIDLDTPCDVFISADYKVIDHFLIPGHASWNIAFAGNEMSVVYTSRSRYAVDINSGNWHRILLRDDVVYGRSDPDSDPCGVRAVIVMKLAELFHEDPSLAEMLLSRHHKMIRPKETDLIALLETNVLDYIFLYRSVAEQHGFEYVALPDSLNLSEPGLNDWYGHVHVKVRGVEPGDTLVEPGMAMVYGITIPDKVNNRELSESFVSFLLSGEGLSILRRNGQNTIVPAVSETWDFIPDNLKKYALPPAPEMN